MTRVRVVVDPDPNAAEHGNDTNTYELEAECARAVLAIVDTCNTGSTATVRWLAELSPIDYERLRFSEAKRLGVRASALDKEVAHARGRIAEDRATKELRSFDPWPLPVPTARLLDDLCEVLRRYVVMPDTSVIATALWILHTHAHDAADISALLAISSPEKRCGKTTLLRLLYALTQRPLLAASLTGANVFRVIERYRPTFLVDEADNYIQDNHDLITVLNSGHLRGVVVPRCCGDDNHTELFDTWAPKAIALIGNLPPTLADRSILIPMSRKRSDEPVERLRLDRLDELYPLGRRCARFGADNTEKLRKADPPVPEALHDRAADNWRSLFAIADLAGGVWSDKAKRAALSLSGVEQADESVRVLLLEDLAALFDRRDSDRLLSAEICDAFAVMEHRPWPEWKGGRPITQTQLSRLLAAFKIRPRTIRADDDRGKGYLRSQFSDVFTRYLDVSRDTVTMPEKIDENADFGDVTNRDRHGSVTGRDASNMLEIKGCHGVTDGNGKHWEIEDPDEIDPELIAEELRAALIDPSFDPTRARRP
jgi:Protein of unknown function (DUF3631)